MNIFIQGVITSNILNFSVVCKQLIIKFLMRIFMLLIRIRTYQLVISEDKLLGLGNITITYFSFDEIDYFKSPEALGLVLSLVKNSNDCFTNVRRLYATLKH